MEQMTITTAQYKNDIAGDLMGVEATIDGKTFIVPMDPANRHYAEILRQVEAGTLTIEDAD